LDRPLSAPYGAQCPANFCLQRRAASKRGDTARQGVLIWRPPCRACIRDAPELLSFPVPSPTVGRIGAVELCFHVQAVAVVQREIESTETIKQPVVAG
jgi:hypothetical protein